MKSIRIRFIAVLLAALILTPVHANAVSIVGFENKIRKAVDAQYSPCKRGDSGSNVLRIKEKLQSIGYFTPGSTLSEDYNDTTVQRVKLFQENNQLTINGEMDERTVSKLKSGNYVYGEYYKGSWSEPAVTAMLPLYAGRLQVRGCDMDYKVRVKNISLKKTIIAIEFSVYSIDVWGDEIIEKAYPYTFSQKMNLKPGQMNYCDYMRVPMSAEADYICIAIKKVRYSDGTTESADTLTYINYPTF